MAILGALEDGITYRNINRYPDAQTDEQILIIRYDDDLFFGNADHFYDEILYEVETRNNPDYVILNAAAMTLIDSTGLHKLKSLINTLKQKGIQTVITNLRGPMRDLFKEAGLNDLLGDNSQFHTIRDAVQFIGKKRIEPKQLDNTN
jgi:SulP family sulfate permease